MTSRESAFPVKLTQRGIDAGIKRMQSIKPEYDRDEAEMAAMSVFNDMLLLAAPEDLAEIVAAQEAAKKTRLDSDTLYACMDKYGRVTLHEKAPMTRHLLFKGARSELDEIIRGVCYFRDLGLGLGKGEWYVVEREIDVPNRDTMRRMLDHFRERRDAYLASKRVLAELD